MKTDKKYASVFELNGMPKFSQAFPLALQHVVAMIVGCVTPAIVIAGVAGLEGNDKVIFVQAALFIAAISTLIQLFRLEERLVPVFRSSWESALRIYQVCRQSQEILILRLF